MRTGPLALALSLVAACSRSSPPAPAQEPPAAAAPPAAGAAPAAPPAAEGPAPASPPAPPARPAPLAVPVTAAVAIAPAGEQPLAGSPQTVVEPDARFRVEVAVPLQDARLLLVDATGAMVAAEGTAEIGASWARFTLAPAVPLVPGSEYSLRLDGAVARTAHDPEGRPYAPSTWPLRTTGEKPKREPAKKPDRRRVKAR